MTNYQTFLSDLGPTWQVSLFCICQLTMNNPSIGLPCASFGVSVLMRSTSSLHDSKPRAFANASMNRRSSKLLLVQKCAEFCKLFLFYYAIFGSEFKRFAIIHSALCNLAVIFWFGVSRWITINKLHDFKYIM